ncbi:Acetyltransferase (GNAT) family protein [Propionibacterium cyclohexanicum]|uniref:Acetyltransferase (GNAT) family protein n=1 Tax=Propionibacterium cyclohexanicum TaxID=64702 RepID=A0A1H9Q4Y4_9ACTN|nr:GNAT family N-acetyltransferase [Propionibacterium cyclohexanicum]SER54989.1 Acetyltransferase (GNAT) family protein [Propionibacterium cyclohexanicum]
MTQEWEETFVDDVLDWSFLEFDDLKELSELRAAIDYMDDPVQVLSYQDLVAAWNAPGSHAHDHAVVGREKGGSIVAYGWNHPTASSDPNPQVWFEIGVHPAWRHQHIRHRLTLWLIARAKQWYLHIRDENTRPLWVGTSVDEKRVGLARSIVEAGLSAQRWFFDMHRPLGTAPLPPMPDLPELVIEPFDKSLSEQVRAAHNEAFASRPGAVPVSRDAWESSLQAGSARLQLSWVALLEGREASHVGAPHGQVVGYAINRSYDDETNEGWTERLGVCSWCRRKGIGRALVIASMRGFAQAGLGTAGVGVDTEDPKAAEEFFGSLGYTATERVVVYGRTMTEADFSQQ